MAQINQATAKLAEADAHAAKLEFPQANAALTAAGVICADARKLADDWGAYAKLRASCAAMVSAFKGFDTAAVTAALNTTIAQADALVAATPPKFVDATAKLQTIDDVIRPKMKVRVDGNKARLVALEALDPKVKTFLVERAHQGALAGGDARVVVRQQRMERPAQRLGRGVRRDGPDGADGAAAPGLRDPAHGHGRGDRRGQGRRHRQGPGAGARRAAGPGRRARQPRHDELHRRQQGPGRRRGPGQGDPRRRADRRLVQHRARRGRQGARRPRRPCRRRPRSRAQLAAIRKLLQDATTAVGLAANNAQAWTTALTAAQRARADLAEAKKVADDLGPTVAAQAAAAKPNDVAGMKTALAQLRADADGRRQAAVRRRGGGAVQELHRRRRQGRQGARQERRQGRGQGAAPRRRRRWPRPSRCNPATASTRRCWRRSKAS